MPQPSACIVRPRRLVFFVGGIFSAMDVMHTEVGVNGRGVRSETLRGRAQKRLQVGRQRKEHNDA